jgi:AhpD family alkylhydroperoxidase
VLATSSLSKRDQETIKLVISGVAGCDYCVAAHSLLGKLAGLRPDELKRIRDRQLTGDPVASSLSGRPERGHRITTMTTLSIIAQNPFVRALRRSGVLAES